MNNNFRIVLFVAVFVAIGLIVAIMIILFLKYFPLGEKRNMDLFLIILSVVSIYYLMQYVVRKLKK